MNIAVLATAIGVEVVAAATIYAEAAGAPVPTAAVAAITALLATVAVATAALLAVGSAADVSARQWAAVQCRPIADTQIKIRSDVAAMTAAVQRIEAELAQVRAAQQDTREVLGGVERAQRVTVGAQWQAAAGINRLHTADRDRAKALAGWMSVAQADRAELARRCGALMAVAESLGERQEQIEETIIEMGALRLLKSTQNGSPRW